jgi:hypothetical protein
MTVLAPVNDAGLFFGSAQVKFSVYSRTATMDFHHRTSSPVRHTAFASVLALALVVYYLWSGSGSLREPFVYRVRITNDPVSWKFNS